MNTHKYTLYHHPSQTHDTRFPKRSGKYYQNLLIRYWVKHEVNVLPLNQVYQIKFLYMTCSELGHINNGCVRWDMYRRV